MKPSFRHRLALRYLYSGVIAHPTDTVYGLACLASNDFAISQLLKLKRRNSAKGLILLASDINFILPYIDPTFAVDLAEKVKIAGSQPTTFLVPANSDTSTLLTGGGVFVAIRITNNALVRFFCENTGSALVSSSANLQGQKTATSLLKLRTYFNGGLAFALAPTQYNTEASTIVNLLTGERIR